MPTIVKRTALILALTAITAAFAQTKDQEQYPSNQVVSGQSYLFYDRQGSGTLTLSYSISGASAVSIAVQGCSADGSACTTLTPITGTAPYTSTSSGQQQFLGGYANYKVTPTFTGGTVGIYKVGIQAKVSAGGPSGGATFPATNGVVCNTSTTASGTCDNTSMYAGTAASANAVPASGVVSAIPASGLLAEYLFTETSGTVLNDVSGAGNNGTISNTPTRDGVGYTWNANTNQIDLPSALNTAQTIYAVMNFPPEIRAQSNPSGVTQTLASTFNYFITNSSTTGFNIGSGVTGLPTLSVNAASNNATLYYANEPIYGTHVVAIQCNGSSVIKTFVDGIPAVNPYLNGNCSLPATGNYRFGVAGTNGLKPDAGVGYYAVAFYSTYHTASQVIATSQALLDMKVRAGVQLLPKQVVSPNARLISIGDSITCGFPLNGCNGSQPDTYATTGYPNIAASAATVSTYVPLIYGKPGSISPMGVGESAYTGSGNCRAMQSSSIATFFMGTNDFTFNPTGNATNASVAKWHSGFPAIWNVAGCRPVLMSMLSRGIFATDGATMDSHKNGLTAIDRAAWRQWGYKGFVDFGTDPLLGGDGAFQGAVNFTGTVTSGSNSITGMSGLTTQNVGGTVTGSGIPANTTITAISGTTVTLSANATASGTPSLTSTGNTYTGDGTHPTQTGYNRIGAALACIINSMDGSSPENMDQARVTASATAACSDGGKLLDATAANITYTLPTAMYRTGSRVRYCNVTPSGSNTVTLASPSDFPFNNVSGTTTISISVNSCINLEATWNGLTTSSTGAYWRVF